MAELSKPLISCEEMTASFALAQEQLEPMHAAWDAAVKTGDLSTPQALLPQIREVMETLNVSYEKFSWVDAIGDPEKIRDIKPITPGSYRVVESIKLPDGYNPIALKNAPFKFTTVRWLPDGSIFFNGVGDIRKWQSLGVAFDRDSGDRDRFGDVHAKFDFGGIFRLRQNEAPVLEPIYKQRYMDNELRAERNPAVPIFYSENELQVGGGYVRRESGEWVPKFRHIRVHGELVEERNGPTEPRMGGSVKFLHGDIPITYGDTTFGFGMALERWRLVEREFGGPGRWVRDPEGTAESKVVQMDFLPDDRIIGRLENGQIAVWDSRDPAKRPVEPLIISASISEPVTDLKLTPEGRVRTAHGGKGFYEWSEDANGQWHSERLKTYGEDVGSTFQCIGEDQVLSVSPTGHLSMNPIIWGSSPERRGLNIFDDIQDIIPNITGFAAQPDGRILVWNNEGRIQMLDGESAS
jgi:hypothetical protein